MDSHSGYIHNVHIGVLLISTGESPVEMSDEITITSSLIFTGLNARWESLNEARKLTATGTRTTTNEVLEQTRRGTCL